MYGSNTYLQEPPTLTELESIINLKKAELEFLKDEFQELLDRRAESLAPVKVGERIVIKEGVKELKYEVSTIEGVDMPFAASQYKIYGRFVFADGRLSDDERYILGNLKSAKEGQVSFEKSLNELVGNLSNQKQVSIEPKRAA